MVFSVPGRSTAGVAAESHRGAPREFAAFAAPAQSFRGKEARTSTMPVWSPGLGNGYCMRIHVVSGIEHVGELCSKKKDHCRVVDPHNHHNQGSGSAIGRTDRSFAQVKAYEQLADGE